MATDNALRVSVRIDLTVGEKPIALIDLSLPAGSSLAEILDEILLLTQAPKISRPWIGRTAAGTPIDAGIPLSQTPLEQGGVLILSPERDLPIPIIRDAAESLVELSAASRMSGLLEITTFAGLILIVVFLCSPAMSAISISLRFLIFSALSSIILVWLPSVKARLIKFILMLCIVISNSLAAVFWLTIPEENIPREWSSAQIALAILCFCCAGLLSTLIIHIVLSPPILLTATISTAFFTLLFAALASALWHTVTPITDFSGPAAITTAGALIAISVAPKLAAGLAGLRVPALPTAGQDLAVSDTEQSDQLPQSQRAQLLLDSIMLGLSIISIPLVLFAATPGTWFCITFTFCVAISTFLHSLRHQRALPAWVLMIFASSAIVASSVATLAAEITWQRITFSLVLTILTSTVTIWSTRIHRPEPTAIVWLERLESLCLAASLPLALHIFGVFELLRGLNISLGG